MTESVPALAGMSYDQKVELRRDLIERLVSAGIELPTESTPGALAARHDPMYRERSYTRIMDEALTPMLTEPNASTMIFSPPQLGKSTKASRWFPFWWQTQRPQDQILLSSYAASLAQAHGAAVRELVRMFGAEYGLRLSRTQANRAAWALTAGGGLRSVGVRGGLSGHPMDLGIIDDPYAGRAEADSPTIRDAVWNWYSGVWSARRSPTAREAIIMCMTGDTPVMMADGGTRPLRDVRPGDQVATYENGALTSANVRNWANQGSDFIYRITMKSGRAVRANARHPFLTIDEDGTEVWKRTALIGPGDAILATGGSGAASNAVPRGAIDPPSARACAAPTTTGSGTQTATAAGLQSGGVRRGSSTDTGSPSSSTTQWSRSRTGDVQSAASVPHPGTRGRIGEESCVSTTTTTPARSGGSCATTATLPLDTGRRLESYAPPLSTYAIEPDEVVSVVPCGVEDVYDVQIDRTENFIANGLVSHNTRWHQDDLAGRLLDRDGRIEEGGRWRVLHLPALALPEDHERGVYVDPLGREPGEPLSHPKIAEGDTAGLLEHWTRQKARSTSRDWTAMYQGTPYAAAGALLTDQNIRDATGPAPDEFTRTAVGVDPAGGGRDTVGIVAAGLDSDRHVWFLQDRTAKLDAAKWPAAVCRVAHEVDADRIVVEKNFGGDMGKQLVAQAWEKLSAFGEVDGLCPLVVEVAARKSKVLRAEPVAQAVLTGRVFFARHAPMKQLQTEFTMWEPGSTWSPGALDAGVHVVTDLLPDVPRGGQITNPVSRRRGEAPGGGLAARRRAG